jgi:hypothetical protein
MAMSGSYAVQQEGCWWLPQLYCPDSDEARNLLRRAQDMAFFFATFHGHFSV